MHTTSLPAWLISQAAVERARFGHITRRTAQMINTRTRFQRARHAPPLGQNVGELINTQLKTRKIRLRIRLRNSTTCEGRENVRCEIARFVASAKSLGLAA